MNVIDMRCRPAFLHDFFGATPGSKPYEAARWLNRRVGTRGDDEHFARSLTHDGFIAEIEQAGVDRAVVVGRQIPGQHIDNTRLADIVGRSNRLAGFASVDPVSDGVDAALREIEHAVRDLGLAAVNIEPGFFLPACHADDAVFLYPLYERCAELGVPVALMSGPTTPDSRFNDPGAVARVARAFPQLPLICYHGFYPNVQQIIGAALLHENIFVVPDMYLFQPGSFGYVEAANGFMADQLLFGSSYPFRPIDQSIEDAAVLGFTDTALEKFMVGNAARLLST